MSETTSLPWDYKKIRRITLDTVFRKGFRAWFALVAVGFLFAFIGTSNTTQTAFIDTADVLIGAEASPTQPGNLDFLVDYIANSPAARIFPFITSDFAIGVIDSLSRSSTWILKILSVNSAYMNRNPGEVIAALLVGALISLVVKFFVQNVAVVGRNRFVMENRFAREVRFKRILAPFRLKTLWNVVRVMLIYHLVLMAWSLTIVGGIYKFYQYFAVPYLLAENPSIRWREAKKLSKQMTAGCKRKLFLTQLSFLHFWLLKLIPVAGLLVAVPLELQLGAELYFTMRGRTGSDGVLLTEKAFDELPYAERGIATGPEPVYLLPDPALERPDVKGFFAGYSVFDYIFMFFLFCFIGWLWECGLHIVQEHEFVNRGTMYGPWIPIYGVGGTGMVLLLDRFKGNKVKLFLLEIGLCAVIEYFGSFLLDFLFNASYWDYKDMFLNVNGRICFAGLLAFGIGGMAAIYVIAPALANFTDKLPRKKKTAVAAVLCSLFAVDLACCAVFGFNAGEGVGEEL